MKAEILTKTISLHDSAKVFSIFHWLAFKWHRKGFIFYVVGSRAGSNERLRYIQFVIQSNYKTVIAVKMCFNTFQNNSIIFADMEDNYTCGIPRPSVPE